MLLDTFNYAFDGLKRRGLRSWLTIIGIVIGVIAIVLLIAFGQAIDVAIREQLEFFGDDTINVAPSGGFIASKGGITEKDFEAIKRIGGIKAVAPIVQGTTQAEYKGEVSTVYVMGFTPEFYEIYKSAELDVGRTFDKNDKRVAILGYKIANDFWGTSKEREVVRLGDRIVIANKSFQVIGNLKKSGGGLAAITEIAVYVPYDDAREVLPLFKNNDKLTRIDIKLEPGTDQKAVKAEIEQKIDNLHRIRNNDERDYNVQTSEQVQETIGSVTMLLTFFLGGIAAISLLVGSIGVANTMFMSVLERTREIGVLKAIGASDSTIRNIFLIESGLLGSVGGIMGVVFSFIICCLLSAIASYAGVSLPLVISMELAAFAVTLSFVIGMVAGYFPATNASKLQVVDALRYE
ncbi:MAG: ABC transporter permease [Candidatus Micrarchaeota archaeon]